MLYYMLEGRAGYIHGYIYIYIYIYMYISIDISTNISLSIFMDMSMDISIRISMDVSKGISMDIPIHDTYMMYIHGYINVCIQTDIHILGNIGCPHLNFHGDI